MNLIDHTIKGSPDAIGVTTDPINSTGADLIILAQSRYQAETIPTISDNKSNGAPIELGESFHAGNEACKFYYYPNPLVGSGHTFIANGHGVATYVTLAVLAIQGAKLNSPVDDETGAVVSGLTLQPGILTPAGVNEILVTALAYNAVSCSIDSGFIISDQVGFVSSYALGLAYKFKTDVLPENPTWTASGSGQMSGRIVSFQPAIHFSGFLNNATVAVTRLQSTVISVTRSQNLTV